MGGPGEFVAVAILNLHPFHLWLLCLLCVRSSPAAAGVCAVKSASRSSLGLQLVHVLAQQLNAKVDMTRGQGTKVELTFDVNR